MGETKCNLGVIAVLAGDAENSKLIFLKMMDIVVIVIEKQYCNSNH